VPSRLRGTSLTPEDLRALITDGRAPVILDVRSEGEFADGHVPGAVNIPFQQVGARITDVPARPDEPIVVYCGHGPRAWIAARALRAHGFSNVSSLKGHWAAWKRRG
jgi:rhodanese-related sulfurtransferase